MSWERKLAAVVLGDLATIGQRAADAVLKTGRERVTTIAKRIDRERKALEAELGSVQDELQGEVIDGTLEDDPPKKGKR